MLVETPGDGVLSREAHDQRALADVCRLRAVLNGLSVVDTEHIVVPGRAAIDDHLRLCMYDTDSPLDNERLRTLLNDAVTYLREQHGFEFPLEVEEPGEIHDLFLLAASDHPRRSLAAITLKVMHILNHVDGRELVHAGNIPESELANRLNTKVLTVIDQIRADGVRLIEWAAGKKTRTSLVTKLLAKRETLATRIYDRLRYRIVTEDRSDLIRALVGLTHRLVPFNYVVPGQSQNGIVKLTDIAQTLAVPLADVQRLWGEPVTEEESPTPQNEFSGSTYRCVNFVADVPVRVDDLAPDRSPAIAFVQAEFQLVDQDTSERNNRGDNAHTAYKDRQLVVVRRRLMQS